MMVLQTRRRQFFAALSALLLTGGSGATSLAAVDVPVLFDFGTDTSPLADSAVRVTGEGRYQPESGFGWTSRGQTSFDRDKPLAELRHGGNPMRPDLHYRRHATPLLRDGVGSHDEMRFRIDVQPGRYRLQVWLGDLHQPLESLAVECNGRPIATGIRAKQIVGRSLPESTGLYRWLRFDAEARNGRIELRFYGDAAKYKQDQRRYDDWFTGDRRVESYLRSGWDPQRRLKFDPGGPFTRNSVLAVRLSPLRPRLISWQGAKLIAVGRGGGDRDRFVAAMNRGDFRGAESVLQADRTAADMRVRGYLALLGHPAVEGDDERRLLARAQQAIDEAGEADRPSVWATEARESLDVFSRARARFLNRGMAEEGHFQENRKVVSLTRIIRPGDLLYYKALVYRGRALQMLDPHRWVYASGDARAVWKELAAAFGNNRYARFFLTDRWTPDDVWHHGDHLTGNEGAPPWAVAQREAWGILLDMCQWWAANKQHADGSIGGGWGDDVELVALPGIMGFISQGASPASLELATRLIEGLWKYGGIDRRAGFYRGLLDAEHSAEWTGDTLPLMLTIDWENPLWVERATQTARLMRDLWMDENDLGDLHFRSNFLGSISIGDQRQANDSYINCRATFPAAAVYRYNRNPTIGKLFVRWADAWLHDAMRTDRGKPRGVFPAEVGFPGGRLGGVGSPNWYTAAHPPGTVNYDWPRGQYYAYLVDLMLLAHEITGDEKYLQPFVLQKRLVDRYRQEKIDSPEPGTVLWAGMVLESLSLDTIWQRVEKARSVGAGGEPPILWHRDEVRRRMEDVARAVKRRWPVLTSETSATDRVGFRGIADPYFVMTGTRDTKPSVTYAGVGRDFAAYVTQTDERLLRIVIYNFAGQPTQAEITPWKLAVGGGYRIRTGTDSDGDDLADRDLQESSFVLQQRGQRVAFTLPPRATTIVEVRQTKPGRVASLYADLAVIPQQIKYSIWTRDLQATVHNVGSRAARRFRVTFYEQTEADAAEAPSTPRKIGSVTVPHLSWPQDLEAKSLTVAVPYVPGRRDVSITVAIDQQQVVPELCESNNRATRRFRFDLHEINSPRERLGEIGGDVSGEIERGIR